MIVNANRNVLRLDPTRTSLLRRQFVSDLLRRIDIVRRAMVELVTTQDVFGLKQLVYHFNPYHEPAGTSKGGEFASGPGSTGLKEKKKGKITYRGDATPEQIQQAAADTQINENNVHFMLGIPENADVDLEYEHSKIHSLVSIQASGRDEKAGTYNCSRTYLVTRKVPGWKTSSNDKWIHNILFDVENTGTGFGIDVFAKQVERGAVAGYDRIETYAARGSSANGYYTWPRFGYDGVVSSVLSVPDFNDLMKLPSIKSKYGSQVGAEVKASDLMKTKEGRDWWKSNGTSVDLQFSLQKDSLSRKVLDAYVQEKKSRTAATTNKGRQQDTRQDLGFVGNARWQFHTDADKVAAFKRWLDQKLQATILEEHILSPTARKVWTSKYIKSAYERGVRNAGTKAGRSEQYLRESLLNSTQQKKLQLLYTRSYHELEGFTSKMGADAAHILADGLAQGRTPNQIATQLSQRFGIERSRARTIARTEIIHAHAEGQLDAFEEAGVDEVEVDAEWVTVAGKGATAAEMTEMHVCPQCQAMSGIVLSIREARGLIPRHPNCRCGWKAATGRKTNRTKVMAAVRRSARAERPKAKSPVKVTKWLGAKIRPKKAAYKRRQGVRNELIFHFNPYHLGPGPHGGEFTSSPSGGEQAVAFNPEGKTTKEQHQNSKGEWTKERQHLHQQILAKLSEGVTAVRTPVSYMTGGGPASGKSSIMHHIGLPDNIMKVDADHIKSLIPEYNKMVSAGDRNAGAFVHQESSYLAGLANKHAVKNKFNLFYDTTGDSSIKSLKETIRTLSGGGRKRRKVVAVYATVEVDLAVKRAEDRGKATGRFVPESAIRGIHAAVSDTFPKAIRKGLFDRVDLYETSTHQVIHVMSAKKTNFVIHHKEHWKRFLAKGRK